MQLSWANFVMDLASIPVYKSPSKEDEKENDTKAITDLNQILEFNKSHGGQRKRG